jgi:hypothetical protein
MIVTCLTDPRLDFIFHEQDVEPIDEQSWKETAFVTPGENYVVTSILFSIDRIYFSVLGNLFPSIPATFDSKHFQVIINQLSEHHFMGETNTYEGKSPFITHAYFAANDIYNELVDEPFSSDVWKLQMQKDREIYDYYQIRFPELLQPFEKRYSRASK